MNNLTTPLDSGITESIRSKIEKAKQLFRGSKRFPHVVTFALLTQAEWYLINGHYVEARDILKETRQWMRLNRNESARAGQVLFELHLSGQNFNFMWLNDREILILTCLLSHLVDFDRNSKSVSKGYLRIALLTLQGNYIFQYEFLN